MMEKKPQGREREEGGGGGGGERERKDFLCPQPAQQDIKSKMLHPFFAFDNLNLHYQTHYTVQDMHTIHSSVL